VTYSKSLFRAKYELQEFLKPSLRITSGKGSTKSSAFLTSSLSRKIMDSFRTNSSSQTMFQEGMVEFIGLLKVTIKKGTNLAIRDMMSSDPYVVLNLGKQVSDLLCIFLLALLLVDAVNLE
jgi:stromal membrane-associated protein